MLGHVGLGAYHDAMLLTDPQRRTLDRLIGTADRPVFAADLRQRLVDRIEERRGSSSSRSRSGWGRKPSISSLAARGVRRPARGRGSTVRAFRPHRGRGPRPQGHRGGRRSATGWNRMRSPSPRPTGWPSGKSGSPSTGGDARPRAGRVADGGRPEGHLFQGSFPPVARAPPRDGAGHGAAGEGAAPRRGPHPVREDRPGARGSGPAGTESGHAAGGRPEDRRRWPSTRRTCASTPC